MSGWILLGSVVLMACIIGNKISSRLGVPTLFFFIALGMLFGSDGLFKIEFGDFVFSEQICSVALIFIMFYGGFGTKWSAAKPVAGKAILLSTRFLSFCIGDRPFGRATHRCGVGFYGCGLGIFRASFTAAKSKVWHSVSLGGRERQQRSLCIYAYRCHTVCSAGRNFCRAGRLRGFCTDRIWRSGGHCHCSFGRLGAKTCAL